MDRRTSGIIPETGAIFQSRMNSGPCYPDTEFVLLRGRGGLGDQFEIL